MNSSERPAVRKSLVALSRLALMAVLGLATLEIAARCDDWVRYRANPLSYYGPKCLRWVDDSGCLFNRPGVRFEKWRNDAHGFRWIPASQRLPNPRKRWICIGTSETYGLNESPGREWPATLGELAAPDGVAVENASVVGMSPFHYPGYLDRYVLPRNPDLVILLVSPFGFVRGMSTGTPPDSLTMADPLAVSRERAACSPTLREHSRFLPKARTVAPRLLPESWFRRLKSFRKQQRMARRIQDVHGAGELLDAPPAEYLPSYHELLGEIVDRVTARGATVAICTYPTALRDDASLPVLGRFYWMASYSPRGVLTVAREYAAATRAFCDSTGTLLIDLDAAVPKDDAHFADSVHFTDAGAAIMAQAVHAALAE